MRRVDCAQQNLDDKLYHDTFGGIDHLYFTIAISFHSATLAGPGKATQLICAPPSRALPAECGKGSVPR